MKVPAFFSVDFIVSQTFRMSSESVSIAEKGAYESSDHIAPILNRITRHSIGTCTLEWFMAMDMDTQNFYNLICHRLCRQCTHWQANAFITILCQYGILTTPYLIACYLIDPMRSILKKNPLTRIRNQYLPTIEVDEKKNRIQCTYAGSCVCVYAHGAQMLTQIYLI